MEAWHHSRGELPWYTNYLVTSAKHGHDCRGGKKAYLTFKATSSPRGMDRASKTTFNA